MSDYTQLTYPNQPFLLNPNKADGPFIYDKKGTKYLDLTAGGTSFNLLGSANTFVNAAITEQMSKYSHLDCKTFGDDNRDKLSELLITGSKLFANSKRKIFYAGGSGSEAIEMAIHLSYQSHYLNGHKSKTWFISRNQSYHGATSGSLSLGERPNLEFYRPLYSQLRRRVSECNYIRNSHNGESIDDYTQRLADEFENIILDIGPENIAGFVAETMMGGLVGDVPPTPNYWKKIKAICEKYTIHLILDEVWCGTGVSGKYHCVEYDNIEPDFLVLGKSLGCGYVPISAVIVPEQFNELISSTTGRVEMSCTFQAHSLAIAAALAVQTIILQEGFISTVYEKGNYIREYLKRELTDCPSVKDIRGRGVRNSLEYNFEDNELFSSQLSAALFEKHNIIMSCKWHRASFSHCMNIDWAEINYFLDKFCSEYKLLSQKMKDSKIQRTKHHGKRNFF